MRRAFSDYRACGVRAYNIVSFVLLVIITVLMLIGNLDDKQRDVRDQMFPTGMMATVAALFLSILTDRSPITLLRKMHNTTLVSLPRNQESRILCYQTKCNMLSHVIYGVVLFLAGLGFTIVSICMNCTVIVADTAPFVAAYVLTGMRFGRMTANGFVLYYARDLCSRVNLRIGHRDGAGGLAIVGQFCWTQVSSLIIPITWLVYWVVAINLDPVSIGSCYNQWTLLFVMLIGLVMSAAWFGCVRPMKTFNEIMVNWKKCRERKHRTSTLGEEQRQSYYYELAIMPNWPASPEDVRIALMGIVFPVLLASTSALLTVILTGLEACEPVMPNCADREFWLEFCRKFRLA